MVAVPLLAGTAAFLAFIQVYCVGLGRVGIPLNEPLALGGGLFALVLAVLFAYLCRRVALDSEPPANFPEATGTTPARAINTVLTWAAIAVFGWTAYVWLQLWWLAWLREPAGWDALWYHIPAINHWVASGGVGFYPPDPALANVPLEVQFSGWLNFPMGVELTAFWLYHLTGSDRLVDAANLLYWPLAVSALVVIAGGLGARGVWRWLAGGLVSGASLFVAQSATAYVDVGFGAAAMASFAAALIFVFDQRGGVWPNALLLGVCVGLMLGTKGFGAPFTVVVIAAAGVGALVHRGWRDWRVALRHLVLAGAVAVAVGGYWYIRNAVHTGNPIYPIQLQLGRKVLVPGYDLTNYDQLDWIVRPALKPYPPWSRIFVAWLQPDVASLHPDQPMHYAPAGGLGYVWLLGGVPAVLAVTVASVRRRRTAMARRFAFLAVSVLLVLSVTTVKWQARYTFWLLALGLPAFALVVSESVARWPARRRHLLTIAAAAGVVGVSVWESRLALRTEWKTGRAAEDIAGKPAFRPAIDSLWPGLRDAPGFAELFAARQIARGPWQSVSGTQAGGVLALPIGRRIVVLPLDPDAQRLRGLSDAGIRWVFWETRDTIALPASLLALATETHRYRRYGDFDFYAVRIAGEGRPGGH